MTGFEPACLKSDSVLAGRRFYQFTHISIKLAEGERFELSQVPNPAVFETAAIPIWRTPRTGAPGFEPGRMVLETNRLPVTSRSYVMHNTNAEERNRTSVITRISGFTVRCNSTLPPRRTHLLSRRRVFPITKHSPTSNWAIQLSKNVGSRLPVELKARKLPAPQRLLLGFFLRFWEREIRSRLIILGSSNNRLSVVPGVSCYLPSFYR